MGIYRVYFGRLVFFLILVFGFFLFFLEVLEFFSCDYLYICYAFI